jgi:hypothetical protein
MYGMRRNAVETTKFTASLASILIWRLDVTPAQGDLWHLILEACR